MATYTALMQFIDEREITIEAETDEEAREKYERGDWSSEDTINFYTNEEIKPLKKVSSE